MMDLNLSSLGQQRRLYHPKGSLQQKGAPVDEQPQPGVREERDGGFDAFAEAVADGATSYSEPGSF